jgi:fumarylacetoacetase
LLDRRRRARVEGCVATSSPRCGLPPRAVAAIGDYTDFFAGINHATNAGKLFRPDNPPMPNYKYVDGHHGRASRSWRPAPPCGDRTASATGERGGADIRSEPQPRL